MNQLLLIKYVSHVCAAWGGVVAWATSVGCPWLPGQATTCASHHIFTLAIGCTLDAAVKMLKLSSHAHPHTLRIRSTLNAPMQYYLVFLSECCRTRAVCNRTERLQSVCFPHELCNLQYYRIVQKPSSILRAHCFQVAIPSICADHQLLGMQKHLVCMAIGGAMAQ